MLALKLLLRLILFPVWLILTFLTVFTSLISKVGNLVMGLFYLYILIVACIIIAEHAWLQLAIVMGISFAVFLVHFGALAAFELFASAKDKLLDVIV
ncbi:hypothetical protein [Butyrivibrio sp. INlla14]|uniref:hypothetical protein n=1 Tax=Butyrivibrio sp. INlla14 TaxID=1520808 RepID=UPI0008763834|nr:hypothetical protein [Butyrivibrio sp. INlla14]SCY49807.1 hypothetical protein SAMN02910371_02529 [Butyrivibrio sp. INlla14]